MHYTRTMSASAENCRAQWHSGPKRRRFMRPQIFGDIRVDAISEMNRWLVDASMLLPDSTPESLAEHLHWLGPRLVDPVSGMLVMSMHAYLIRTRHHTILFDTCCGNDK